MILLWGVLYKKWEPIVTAVKTILQTKTHVLEKLTKIDFFYQTVLFVGKNLTFIENDELHSFNNI